MFFDQEKFKELLTSDEKIIHVVFWKNGDVVLLQDCHDNSNHIMSHEEYEYFHDEIQLCIGDASHTVSQIDGIVRHIKVVKKKNNCDLLQNNKNMPMFDEEKFMELCVFELYNTTMSNGMMTLHIVIEHDGEAESLSEFRGDEHDVMTESKLQKLHSSFVRCICEVIRNFERHVIGNFSIEVIDALPCIKVIFKM